MTAASSLVSNSNSRYRTAQHFDQQTDHSMIRQVQDLVRKLEQVHAEAKSVTDLFTARALQLRSRIRDMCLTIRITDFGEDGRKAEDTIWRRVFYSVIQKFKRFPEAPTARATSLMECHFLSAVGFYCNMIHLFAGKGLDVSIIMNTGGENGRVMIEEEAVRTAMRHAVHRCLTYIGDCYRYLDELATASAKTNSMYWYNKAIIWDPANGMPFNQLATLMYSNNYGLDAVYYYLRCICSEIAFDGAELNLKRIISCRLKGEASRKNPSHDAVRIVRMCIESFRQIICQILFSSSSSHSSESLTLSIDNFILNLNKAAKLASSATSVPSKPAFLDDGIWFKMGLIIMMTKMRVNQEDKRLAVYYLLRHFFVSLVATVTSDITCFCVQKEHPAEKSSPTASSSESTESDDRKSRENTPEISPFRQTVRSRKRKRALHAAGQDQDEEESDCSELEETALRAIGALDISSDFSGDEFANNITSSPSSQEEEQDSQSFSIKTTQVVGLHGDSASEQFFDTKGHGPSSWSSLQQLYQHSPIQTLKVFCDIFVSNPLLLDSCAFEESQWNSLVKLINLCLVVEKEISADSEWKFKLTKRPQDEGWQQRIPLLVDWTLMRFPLVASVHQDLLFSAGSRLLAKTECSFLCLQRIISFGVSAARITQVIDYDADHCLFTLSSLFAGQVSDQPVPGKLFNAGKGWAK